MMFQRTNRGDAEKLFVSVLNNEGSAMVVGQTVQWEPASASVDGVRVRDVDTGNLFLFAGIVDAAIAASAYGLIQIYGYRTDALYFQTDTSVATGLPLVPVAGQRYLNTFASSFTAASNTTVSVTFAPIFGALLESVTDQATSSARATKVFIRAM